MDTLKQVSLLKDAGIETLKAEAIVKNWSSVMNEHIATKRDLSDLNLELKTEVVRVRTELKGDIKNLRTELKGDIKSLRTELKGDIKSLRTELKGDISKLDDKVEKVELSLTIKLGAMLLGFIGILRWLQIINL